MGIQRIGKRRRAAEQRSRCRCAQQRLGVAQASMMQASQQRSPVTPVKYRMSAPDPEKPTPRLPLRYALVSAVLLVVLDIDMVHVYCASQITCGQRVVEDGGALICICLMWGVRN